MRNEFFRYLAAAALLLPVFAMPVSCSKDHVRDSIEGRIKVSFPEEMYKAALEHFELPDTNDFILDIKNSAGESVYSGCYGDSPETIIVPSGSYTVKVRSFDFGRPQFSRPQFGDEQCVVVPADGEMKVKLECRQINSGIRLKISPDFLKAFPEGVLFVSSGEGRLMYGYSEKRIAYFNPGAVSVVLEDGGVSRTLVTRTLRSQEILTLGIYVSDDILEEDPGCLSISIDTARIWNDESYVIGGSDEDKGNTFENALSVNQARASIGDRDVWVCGYITGGDLGKSSISFSPPFASRTNIAISARSTASGREACLSVSLPSGDVRDALNLVDHPENLGRRIYLNGDIVESYFGLTGIKNVSDYVLK